MKKIVFNAPVNNLSFGNVSVNLIREMWKREIGIVPFPIGDKASFESFDALTAKKDFVEWFTRGFKDRLINVRKDFPSVKLWHLNGATERITSKQFLYTFHETSGVTPEEIATINLQDGVMVSSNYTRGKFVEHGIDPSHVVYVPLGVDEDFVKIEKPNISKVTNFCLMGKWEKRKHTSKIIALWAKKYGNNRKYHLNCLVNNPFFPNGHMNACVQEALAGKPYHNINFIPYIPGNSTLNKFMNNMDIDLTGLSGAEGWNLPSFNMSALGKWSVVLNATSHKDWATPENSILVEPSGTEPATDGMFFDKGGPFNQGEIFTWDEDAASEAMDKALGKALSGTPNIEGENLRRDFTYSKTLDSILSVVNHSV